MNSLEMIVAQMLGDHIEYASGMLDTSKGHLLILFIISTD